MEATMDKETFTSMLASYMAKAEAVAKAAYEGAHAGQWLSIVPGRKFVHIVWNDGIGRSAFVAVNKTTGDIHDSDGWKRAGRRVSSLSAYLSAALASEVR